LKAVNQSFKPTITILVQTALILSIKYAAATKSHYLASQC